MKWFNLSLLLVAIALGVVLVVEPVMLNNLVPENSVKDEPLPDPLASIQTIDELWTPLALIPSQSKDAETPAVESPPAKPQTAQVGQAQTRELENVVFVAEELEKPAAGGQSNARLEPPVSEASGQPESKELSPAEIVNPPEPAISCYRYGPLKNFKEVAAAGDLLVKQKVTAEWFEIEVPYAEFRYWVVLDEASSRQQARDWVQKLDDKKFGDHYMPLESDEPYLISLGVFKTQGRAERHLASLKAAGFPVELRTKSLELSRRWLMFESAADTKPPIGNVVGSGGCDYKAHREWAKSVNQRAKARP